MEVFARASAAAARRSAACPRLPTSIHRRRYARDRRKDGARVMMTRPPAPGENAPLSAATPVTLMLRKPAPTAPPAPPFVMPAAVATLDRHVASASTVQLFRPPRWRDAQRPSQTIVLHGAFALRHNERRRSSYVPQIPRARQLRQVRECRCNIRAEGRGVRARTSQAPRWYVVCTFFQPAVLIFQAAARTPRGVYSAAYNRASSMLR